MLELGVGADIVRGVGDILWGILAIALLVALFKPKTIKGKVLSSLLVLGIFFAPMVPGAMRAHEYKQRYAKAKALFDERCKTAGEKIYRTVEGVDSVRLLNVRPEQIDTQGQFTLDDQYGHDLGGIPYIASFLRPTEKMNLANGISHLNTPGYRFIEIHDGSGVKRYSKSFKLHPNGDSYPSTQETSVLYKNHSRYAVQYIDVSTPGDRENWIAGGSIKIIDIEKSELIAERIGFLFDTGLGNTNGGRTPWSWARYYVPACPPVAEHNQVFTFKVLKPIKGE